MVLSNKSKNNFDVDGLDLTPMTLPNRKIHIEKAEKSTRCSSSFNISENLEYIDSMKKKVREYEDLLRPSIYDNDVLLIKAKKKFSFPKRTFTMPLLKNVNENAKDEPEPEPETKSRSILQLLKLKSNM